MKRYLPLTILALTLAAGTACGQNASTNDSSGRWPSAAEAAFRSSLESNFLTASGGIAAPQAFVDCALEVTETRYPSASDADAAAINPTKLASLMQIIKTECATHLPN